MNKENDENYNSAVHIIKRLNYIDILKGFGILFVILGHIQQYIPSWLLIYIYILFICHYFTMYQDIYIKKNMKKWN